MSWASPGSASRFGTMLTVEPGLEPMPFFLPGRIFARGVIVMGASLCFDMSRPISSSSSFTRNERKRLTNQQMAYVASVYHTTSAHTTAMLLPSSMGLP
eukprot:114286-Chlamydomonas_euryale.AAC.3